MVTVGDGFTMASTLDEPRVWPRHLARHLDAPVANLAVDGYCPTQAVRVFEDFGLSRRPAVAVLTVFEGNDVEQEARFAAFEAGDRPWNRILRRRLPRYRYCLLRALLLPSRERSPVQRTLWAAGPGASPFVWEERPGSLNPVVFESGGERLGVALDPAQLLRLARSPQEWTEEPGWDPLLRAVETFARLAREREIQPLVVLIPSKEGLLLPRLDNREHRARLASAWAGQPDDFDYEAAVTRMFRHRAALRELLARTCASRDIPVLDLEGGFARRLSKGRQPYLPFGTHLSTEGHALTAKILLIELRRRGWTRGQEGPDATPQEDLLGPR